jgi:TRAP-type C4-dicarboxylate transport system permease large subunit
MRIKKALSIVPFVALQITGLVLVIVFPQLALWLPRAAGLLI